MIDEAEINRLANSTDVEERKTAVKQLRDYFVFFSDKKTAWSALHRLMEDVNSNVRGGAVSALGPSFSDVPDKKAAWSALHRLTEDENGNVRGGAVSALGSSFSHAPDKKAACSDLIRLSKDKNKDVRRRTASAIGSSFSDIPDKKAAWSALHSLTKDEGSDVRKDTALALGSCFSDVPDKKAAWSALHHLTKDEDSDVRRGAASAIVSSFTYVPDKKAAWSALHRLTKDEDSDVRRSAASAIGSSFSDVPDKKAAWSALHRLTKDEDSDVRRSAASASGSSFSDVPDKKAAWSAFHRLTKDESSDVRRRTALALGSCFSDVPDIKAAWSALHRLTKDEDSDVRRRTAFALGSCFSDVPDKKAAWSAFHHLTKDEDSDVQKVAAFALGSSFSDVPDKNAAWSALHRLTKDEDSDVRTGAASAIGSSFSYVPDKKTAWSALHSLAQDKENKVRKQAYHSLGSAFVYKATEAGNEEIFRDELEKAIDLFEKSSKEAKGNYNPARFCLPFYRSYYAVVSEMQETEAETAKYLNEARKAVDGSESREILLKAVENLGNALKEAHKPDFGETKEHLRACRQHCDHTAELADNAREKSPVAAAAIERGIQIVGGRVKEIIAEIQEKAKALYKQTEDTPLEPLGLETNERAEQLSNDNVQSLNAIMETVLKFCDYLPLEKKTPICKKIQMGINLDDKIEKVNIIQESLDGISNNISLPRLNYIHISETKKNIIRIATVQLNFQLTDSFPPTLTEMDATKKIILSALETAKNEGAEIVCLPELCIYEEWVEDIGNQFSNMIIIPGSYYDSNNQNRCKSIFESDIRIQPQIKMTPSAFEDSRVMGSRMTCGEKIINIYQTKFGSFAILICRDFGNYIHYLRGKVDIVFVPA